MAERSEGDRLERSHLLLIARVGVTNVIMKRVDSCYLMAWQTVGIRHDRSHDTIDGLIPTTT